MKPPTTGSIGMWCLQLIDNAAGCAMWLTRDGEHTPNFRLSAQFRNQEDAVARGVEMNKSYRAWPVKSISGIQELHITTASLYDLRKKEGIKDAD